MPKSKYGKYIITEPKSEEELISMGFTPQKRSPGVPYVKGLAFLDEKRVKGAFYMEVAIMEPGSKRRDTWVKAHIHDYDEILGFVGTSVKNPQDLGGEIELWLDDEKHILTKSCLVFVPKGFKHCPLSLNRVDTPIVHFSVLSGAPAYLWTDV